MHKDYQVSSVQHSAFHFTLLSSINAVTNNSTFKVKGHLRTGDCWKLFIIIIIIIIEYNYIKNIIVILLCGYHFYFIYIYIYRKGWLTNRLSILVILNLVSESSATRTFFSFSRFTADLLSVFLT